VSTSDQPPPFVSKTWVLASSFIGPVLFVRFPDNRRLVVFLVLLLVFFVLVIILVRVLRRQAPKVRLGSLSRNSLGGTRNYHVGPPFTVLERIQEPK